MSKRFGEISVPFTAGIFSHFLLSGYYSFLLNNPLTDSKMHAYCVYKFYQGANSLPIRPNYHMNAFPLLKLLYAVLRSKLLHLR